MENTEAVTEDTEEKSNTEVAPTEAKVPKL
jgi:hypothetical protein